MTIKSIVETSLQSAAVQLSCSMSDLRLIGRPTLIYEMFLQGELPDCIFIVTNKIPERPYNEGYASDLMIVHREDIWRML